MNKFMRKVTVLTLALIIAATAMAFAQPAESFLYKRTSDGKGIIITGYKGKTFEKVSTVPARIENLPVVEIGDWAFKDNVSVQPFTIPNGVKKIGAEAFYGCKGLSSITIPPSVTHIDDGAFGRTGLQTVVIPNSVTQMGTEVFMGCTVLREVTLSNALKEIEAQAFQGCNSLRTITIPASVTMIGEDAFNCPVLTTITILRESSGAQFTGVQLENNSVFPPSDNVEIRVPKNSVNAYRTAKNWNNLKGIPVENIVEIY